MISGLLWLCTTLGINKLQAILLLSVIAAPMALSISEDKNRPIENWEIREWMQNDIYNKR